jgi:hypothetical protein
MKKIHNNFVMQECEMLRILICYIFSNESLNLTRDIVIYCLQILNVANFFDLSSTISSLVKGGVLILLDDGRIVLSEKGRTVNETLSSTISDNIKHEVMQKIYDYLSFKKNIDENNVILEKIDDKYLVKCHISGSESDFMKLSIEVSDIKRALNIKRNFYKNLSNIYVYTMSKLFAE